MKKIAPTLIALFFFGFFASANAQTKLIVIYDDDCSHCKDLLEKTYTNEKVKDKLKDYEVEMFEIKSIEAITYIGNYGSNIVKVPTQIFLSDDIKVGDVVIMGFRDVGEQLEILEDPFAYATAHQEDNRVEKYLSKLAMFDICADVNSARNGGRDTYKELVKYIQEYADEEGIAYKEPEELISKHFMRIQCRNTDSLKIREKASLFKYSIEKRDYKLLRSALLVRNDKGERVCNPDIDFSQTETIDGKEESLFDFINKILKRDGMSAVHDFPGLKTLRLDLKRCVKEANAQ